MSLALQWNLKWPSYTSSSPGAPYMASASLCAVTSAGPLLLPTSLSLPYPFSRLCLIQMAHCPFSLHRYIRDICMCLLCGGTTGCSWAPVPAVIAMWHLLSCYLQIVQSFWELQKLSLLPEAISCDPPALVLPQLRELQHFLGDKKSALLWGTCLIFVLTKQCNQVVLNFAHLTIAV